MFAEYAGFGDIFNGVREVPVADPFISVFQMRSLGYTNEEIDTHRKEYQFLRSALKSKVDQSTLYCAHFPTEAWHNLEVWHNPKTIAATQDLHDRFQYFSMKPGQNPFVVLIHLEEMVAQMMQQDFPMAPN